MKKCSGCNKEIDKYAIACEYCGKFLEAKARNVLDNESLKYGLLTQKGVEEKVRKLRKRK